MSVEILARFQFALTIAFHYIFPPISIGLALALVIMEGLFLKTKNPMYESMTRFWVKIFALVFGIGVASGLVMEFQFGTNWATYSRYVGDIFGSALAAEGVFAFFLESGFLAILVFGWDRVSPKMHFFSTIMVALGSTFSAVWIVVANSWMQTPAGYKIVEEAHGPRARITDFWAMVFNPSSVDRLSHVVSAAWLTGAFFVVSVGAYYLLKGRHLEIAKNSVKIGLSMALVAAMLQLFTGHRSVGYVAEHQPAKLAAMEGHIDSTKALDLILFGITDKDGKASGLSVPGGGSYLLYGNTSQAVPGLDSIPADERPPVALTFQSYHLMIMIGFALIGITLAGGFLWWRGKLWDNKLMLTIMAWSVLLPQLGNQLGWTAAEVGRQPWIVYGMLRTNDAISKAVSAGQVWFSLVMFSLVYLLLFVLFIYLLDRKIKEGPGGPLEGHQTGPGPTLQAVDKREVAPV
jgi:cytochrome d ubiquinol oxidase subunit I